MFFRLRPCHVEPKNQQKCCQEPSKNTSQINTPTCIDFGTNLAPFWEGFGSQVGAKLEQNGSKSRSQKQSKNHHLLDRSWERFFEILGPNMPPKRGPQKLIFGGFLPLGAILEPRWPQDPPRPLQEASWERF